MCTQTRINTKPTHPRVIKKQSHFCCGSACTLNMRCPPQEAVTFPMHAAFSVKLSLCYVESLTSEPVISRTSSSLSMLGLQLNVKIWPLYSPQHSPVCVSLTVPPPSHTNAHTHAQIESKLHYSTTYFLNQQSLYIKYMEPDETNQLREGNQKGEIRGGSFEIFPSSL